MFLLLSEDTHIGKSMHLSLAIGNTHVADNKVRSSSVWYVTCASSVLCVPLRGINGARTHNVFNIKADVSSSACDIPNNKLQLSTVASFL
jgi:hypothetical protein